MSHSENYQQVRFGPRMTPVVKWLIITNVCIHLVLLAISKISIETYTILFLNLTIVAPEFLYNGKIWQVFTYAFLHAPNDAFHILFNMLGLWMFGAEIESYWGKRPFLLFYFLCALGGGLAVVVAYVVFGKSAFTLGASGAVLGIIAAYGVVFGERLISLLFPPVSLKAKWMALAFIVFDLFYYLHGQDFSLAAHLGGALTGFLYAKSRFRFSASATLRIGGLTLRQHLKRWSTRRHLRVIVHEQEEKSGAHFDDGPTFH